MDEKLRSEMNQVFTPGYPISHRDFFKGRVRQLARILETVPSPGRHPIVFGQRGVGKTSLVSILVELFPQFLTVKMTCDGADTFKSIWNRILQQATITFKEQAFGFSREESEKKVSLASFIGSDNGVRPADIAMLLARLRRRAIFVIDEFDRVTDPHVHTAMADLIKNLSDNVPLATLVIVGVAGSIFELVGAHPSVERNLVEIELPVMKDDEIKQIVSNGCDRLGIVVDDDVMDEVARLATGYPHFAHLLGLSIAKTCYVQETKRITRELFQSIACGFAIDDAIETYRQLFSKATKTAKASRYPQILCACAVASHDENGVFRATDVVEGTKVVTVQSVVPALQAFTENERGAVLVKVPFGAQSHYRFREPMMRPFLRIRTHTLQND